MRGGCKQNLGELSHGVCHASQWLSEMQEEAHALVGKVDLVWTILNSSCWIIPKDGWLSLLQPNTFYCSLIQKWHS